MKLFVMLMAFMMIGQSTFSQENKSKGNKDMKVLVAYFSASCTTRSVAQKLAEVTGGTLHQITPAQPYTDADLDWRDKQSRSSVEMQDKKSRPAITNKLADMNDYDVVYVGFPIWWNTCPTIINTFMESYDFQGKTVIPFAACEDLKASYSNVNWKEGKLLNRASKDDLKKWVENNK